MPVLKVCVVCGKSFSVPPSRALTASTCSNACAISVRAKSRDRGNSVACKNCGKEFHIPASHKGRRVYCSKECKHKSITYTTDISDRTSGDKNPMWIGGEVVRDDGYIYKRFANHHFSRNGYVLKHRLVMEEWLKEECKDSEFLIDVSGELYLKPDIDVHHCDENRQNNERENLLACTTQTHRSIHSGYGVQEGTFWPSRGDLVIDNRDPKKLQEARRKMQRLEKQINELNEELKTLKESENV